MVPFGDTTNFDATAPRLRDVPSLDKQAGFVESCVEKFLVAAIGHGEDGLDKVRHTANKLYDFVEPVDPMALSTREAAWRREIVDAALALRGLLGSSDTQIKLRSEIELLQVDSGKTGRGICVQVANAVMHDSYFKGLLQTYQQVIPVLIQLQPEYARFAELFKISDTSNVSEFAKCLIGACEVVSTFASEPSTPLYVEFQKMVAPETQTFFGDSHAKVLADLRVDTENIGKAKETMGHLSACLSEVGIAFPMESWASEVSEEHSNILKQTDSTQLSVTVCCAMEDMTSCVWESRKPPDATRLRDFDCSFA
jgi:hypothetical protein